MSSRFRRSALIGLLVGLIVFLVEILFHVLSDSVPFTAILITSMVAVSVLLGWLARRHADR